MLDSLRLQQFRSYQDASFEFEPGVNIIVGPNASGKTNLLEAILVLSRTSSYRGTDKDLLQIGATWAKLSAQIKQHNRVVKLKLLNNTLNKTTTIDSKEYKRLPHQERLPVVLFEPNHLRVLSGSPDNRRQFFDSILESTQIDFGRNLRRYQRVLAQRNTLLKQHSQPKELFVWDVRLVETAQKLVESRLGLIEHINKKISNLYRKISNQKKANVTLKYISSCNTVNYSSSFLKLLEQNSQDDKHKGFTSVGPHRDDVCIYLNQQNSNQTASRGETRTLLLALKIVELHLLEQTTSKKPILLLDDVFSELDGARRQALTKLISDHQTFITTTDADVVVQHFMDNCHIIPLNPKS